jgi:hypothetical protein
MLGEVRHDHLWDFMWVVFGVALGGAPSSWDHVWGMLHSTPIDARALAEVVITCSCAAVFVVLYLAVYMRKKPATNLATTIRERTKQIVG